MRPTESEEQIAVMEFLAKLEEANRLFIVAFAIPNGGSRNMLEAKKMKREGVLKGVSDLCIILKERVLFVEMKRRPKILKSDKESFADIKPSKEQLEFLVKVTENKNIDGMVCYGADDFKIKFEEYLEDIRC